MAARQDITQLLKKTLQSLDLGTAELTLERPVQREHGDFASNVALVLAKEQHAKPHELATKIVQSILTKKPEFLEEVKVAGPGFINFYLSKKYFEHMVSDIRKEGEVYGKTDLGKKRTAIVEYSSPNIAKPFTIGHLRSTIIGDAIANILAFSGYTVLRDNHLGDWGTQFGKQIVAIKKWGNEEELDTSKEPVKLLVDLYVKFHTEAETDPTLEDEARAWFTKLEKGDTEARRLWKKCIDWSMVQFKAIYKQLGVKFDMMLGESFFEDKMGEVIADLKSKKIAKISEGALLVFFPKDKYPPLMILKKDGSTLYATRDLATDRYRINTWGKDILIINEVGAEQALYFKQIYETEEMLGYLKKSQRVHVGHGMIRLKEGKMSTRKGNTIWLESVLAEAVERAAKFKPEVAEIVGIGALKYNDLKRESIKDIMFDWEDILNLKGNSGPYLQYTYARAMSVLRKAAELPSTDVVNDIDQTIATVETLLDWYPEVVLRAAQEYAPHHICTYLFDLAQAFNAYYSNNKIIGSGKAESYRLALTQATAQVVQNALKLLGIQTPLSM